MDMKNGREEIAAVEMVALLARVADALEGRGDEDDLPVGERLWTLKHVGQYLQKKKDAVARVTKIDGFPRPIQWTFPDGTQSQALYEPSEVRKWALDTCRKSQSSAIL
jgi:hypothetical protein